PIPIPIPKAIDRTPGKGLLYIYIYSCQKYIVFIFTQFLLDKCLHIYIGTAGGNIVPHTVLIDLEPGVIDKIMHSPTGPLFHPDSILTRVSGAGNNWAKGHYTMGAEVIDEAMDIIRKNVEVCDSLQGFQLSHSIGIYII
ncbi:MAG: hypothetical protein GY755_25005, partial [Chloroflexi bacterium]|nr:hypothetical protein [Chloroflexota bacterium]